MRYIALLLLSLSAHALELERVAINYRDFVATNYMLEIPGFKPKEAINLHLDVNLIGPLYWRNTIDSLTDGGGYRYIAWNFQVGAQLTPSLALEFEHLSGHMLDHGDMDYPSSHYPVNDSVGLWWTLYRGDLTHSLIR